MHRSRDHLLLHPLAVSCLAATWLLSEPIVCCPQSWADRYNFRGEGGEPGDVYIGDSENHVVVRLKRSGLNVSQR